jgi:hypothetical protein
MAMNACAGRELSTACSEFSSNPSRQTCVFLGQRQIYSNHSTIALRITGTSWSGRRFFGLRDGADPGGCFRNLDSKERTDDEARLGSDGPQSLRIGHAERVLPERNIYEISSRLAFTHTGTNSWKLPYFDIFYGDRSKKASLQHNSGVIAIEDTICCL